MMTISLDEQIQEVRRELALRRNVYPAFVVRGRLSAATAERQISRMRAVLETLESLRQQQQ